jgi:hypothetical protein
MVISASLETQAKRKDKTTGAEWSSWSWSCEAEKLPGYTVRAKGYEAAARSLGAYSLYSAAAHAEWHAVMAGWREQPQPDGSSILVARPDLWAAGGTVLGSAGCVIVSVHRALELLGRGARRRAQLPRSAGR